MSEQVLVKEKKLAPATVSEGIKRLIAEGYVRIEGTRDIVLCWRVAKAQAKGIPIHV